MRKRILFLAAVSLVLFAEKALCYETTFSIEPEVFNSFRYHEMRVEEAAPLSIRTGRFLSVDPGGFDPRQPQSWNRYSYVMNNPINRTDPTGRCGEAASFVGPRVPCAERVVQGVLAYGGAAAVSDAAVRQQYVSTVAKLSPTDTAARTAAKIAAREATTPTGRAIAEAMRPMTGEAARVGGTASKTNAAVNDGMAAASRVGKVALVAGATIQLCGSPRHRKVKLLGLRRKRAVRGRVHSHLVRLSERAERLSVPSLGLEVRSRAPRLAGSAAGSSGRLQERRQPTISMTQV